MHKFDPEKLKKLDDPERLKLFDPEKVLKAFGLKPGMVVLDVGTGAGFYLPYLSRIVGEEGRVYGVDISQEAVEYASKKVKELELRNVEIFKSEENYIPLSENLVDFTFMAFVFHELDDPVRFLKELKRVSKPMGYLALIDWKKEERDMGPPPEEVYSEWEVGMILEEAGLRVGRVVEVGPYAYGFYAVFLKGETEQNHRIMPPGIS